ncbi:MAG: CocE/NonD family hydrolase [Candidatus Aminicenantaceae bacterium]
MILFMKWREEKRISFYVTFALWISVTIVSSASYALEAPAEPSQPVYDFVIENSWLTMPDGVRLSVTFFRPTPRSPEEKFPVLFEYLPYRKDDTGPMRASSNYTYFIRRGYIMARVDIRGTGSSEGAVPSREYSEQELDDAVVIIDQLSKFPESNGRVGMWGISWGGFNSIQVAMRQPPALKAILPTAATDDLFHDDVHHMDGAFHIDQFMPVMDHGYTLPQTPDYKLDEAYFQDRFNTYPWFLTYAKNQLDGEFWRKNSLRWQYDKIRIPCYLIGGLLDGYRDSIPRMLANMKVPIRAALGPYKHDWPHNGVPGPNYEWRHEAVRWWDYWLKDRDTGIMDDAPLALFMREGHGPDMDLQTTPGHWICDEWPIPGTTWKKFYPSRDRQLTTSLGEETVEKLRYVPSYGVQTGLWWGEPTGDIRPDDAGALVYDSPVLTESFEIAGFPKVHLRVSADAPLAHWVARLEDVQPDGTISLVTGMLLNGSQRNSRLKPEALVPGEVYNLEFEMHFTTWTFKPGHRIRVAVSNALFPMIWPTPYPMTTELYLGAEKTCVELPVIPSVKYQVPAFLPPEPPEERPESRWIVSESYPWPRGFYEWKRDLWSTKTSVEWKGYSNSESDDQRYYDYERNYYETNDVNPAESQFSGEAGRRMELNGRKLHIRTTLDVYSDEKNFYVTIVRDVYENDSLVRQREWKETIPRLFN